MFTLISLGVLGVVLFYMGSKAPTSPLGRAISYTKSLVGRETTAEKAARLKPKAQEELNQQIQRVAELRAKFESNKRTQASLANSVTQMTARFEGFAKSGDREAAQRAYKSMMDYKAKLERLTPIMEEQHQMIDQYMKTIRENREQLNSVNEAVEHQQAMSELEKMITDLEAESRALSGGQSSTALGELKGLSGEIEQGIEKQRALREVRRELGTGEEIKDEDPSSLDFDAAFNALSMRALPEPTEKIQIGTLNAVSVEK